MKEYVALCPDKLFPAILAMPLRNNIFNKIFQKFSL